MRQYKGIICDLDGVICSTDAFHFLAWKRLALRLGIPFSGSDNDRLRGISRMESLEIILSLGDVRYSQAEKEVFAEEKNGYYRELLSRMSPSDVSDEVRETFDHLHRDHQLAVASSSKNARLILERIGFGSYFDAVVDGTDISRSKPDPEVFLKAAERLGLEPAVCLVIEDAPAGAEAARAGGFDCAVLGAAAGKGLSGSGLWVLKSFGELASLA